MDVQKSTACLFGCSASNIAAKMVHVGVEERSDRSVCLRIPQGVDDVSLLIHYSEAFALSLFSSSHPRFMGLGLGGGVHDVETVGKQSVADI